MDIDESLAEELWVLFLKAGLQGQADDIMAWVSTRDMHRGASLMHLACYNASPASVELLVEAGMDVNIKTEERSHSFLKQMTPLHVCAQGGTDEHRKLAAYLLSKGADATKREGTYNQIPAYYASGELKTLLVEHVEKQARRHLYLPSVASWHAATSILPAVRVQHHVVARCHSQCHRATCWPLCVCTGACLCCQLTAACVPPCFWLPCPGPNRGHPGRRGAGGRPCQRYQAPRIQDS